MGVIVGRFPYRSLGNDAIELGLGVLSFPWGLSLLNYLEGIVIVVPSPLAHVKSKSHAGMYSIHYRLIVAGSDL